MRTLGERRTNNSLTNTELPIVEQIRRTGANFIDALEEWATAAPAGILATSGDAGEVYRCLNLAKTNMEQAVMWAVKGVTKLPVPPVDYAPSTDSPRRRRLQTNAPST